MFIIHDDNIWIKIYTRNNNKKGWKCWTLTFKEHIYTGYIDVIKVLGYHSKKERFMNGH